MAHMRKYTVLLPDILIAVWLLYILIQMSSQGTVTLDSTSHFLLFIGLYWTGRLTDRVDIVEKVFTVILMLAAALCLFYLIYDSSVFQYSTFVSSNLSVLAIQMAIAASCCFAVIKNQQSLT